MEKWKQYFVRGNELNGYKDGDKIIARRVSNWGHYSYEIRYVGSHNKIKTRIIEAKYIVDPETEAITAEMKAKQVAAENERKAELAAKRKAANESPLAGIFAMGAALNGAYASNGLGQPYSHLPENEEDLVKMVKDYL